MTVRLVLTKDDPRCTDFVRAGHGEHAGADTVYTVDTTYYSTSRTDALGRATTTVTRTGPSGERLQAGVIEWPLHSQDPVQVVVGTRSIDMIKSGIFTSPERFIAADGDLYEWQIRDARPQLVAVRGPDRASTAYVATFVRSRSGSWFRRKYESSLFIPPESLPILDDIIMTFIYFESKWRDKESAKSRVTTPLVFPPFTTM